MEDLKALKDIILDAIEELNDTSRFVSKSGFSERNLENLVYLLKQTSEQLDLVQKDITTGLTIAA